MMSVTGKVGSAVSIVGAASIGGEQTNFPLSSRKVFRKSRASRKLYFLAALVIAFAPHSAKAIDPTFKALLSPRFALYVEQTNASQKYDARYATEMAQEAMQILDSLDRELAPLFAGRPIGQIVVRFLSEDSFYRETSAPSWTSALFSRGEIRIPVAGPDSLHPEEFRRTLRHEYIHAVIAQLSDFRCPAWLDEGLAQLIEGRHSPRLAPALRQWIAKENAFQLASLRRGFTELETGAVPAAYAQSLYASQKLVEEFGLPRVLTYLDMLRTGSDWSVAFGKTFGYSVKQFEQKLTADMRRWAATNDDRLVWTSISESDILAAAVSNAAAE